MDVKDAIISRRSVFKFKQELVPNDVLEQIFSYGIWTQNHHIAKPGRFTVIGEKTRQILSNAFENM